ncbi:hypothetical protein EV207_15317 [Scopulibacillus darangshiensis]|uniref:Uncharacterized protein n=1 Tax=Scopulibacillus darangshiensis TaxID=442528 RepID=A0A4R2NFY5_9BACL|nr:hypothetical protein [Scopulibacillus darangshiensis]TCP20299.1 hypothetical protein EV207_15317 [Scopulibacillus darangshiensis]
MIKTKQWYKRFLFLGLILLVITGLCLPLPAQKAASASGNSGGFMIEADKVEGAINIPAILVGKIAVKEGKIYGLTLTKELKTAHGTIVIKIKSPGPIDVKDMKADLMGLPTFTGLYLPDHFGWIGMKNVKMKVSKQTASLLTLPGAQVETSYGRSENKETKALNKEDLKKLAEKMKKVQNGEDPNANDENKRRMDGVKSDIPEPAEKTREENGDIDPAKKQRKETKAKEDQKTEDNDSDGTERTQDSDDHSTGGNSGNNGGSSGPPAANPGNKLKEKINQLNKQLNDLIEETSGTTGGITDQKNKLNKLTKDVDDVLKKAGDSVHRGLLGYWVDRHELKKQLEDLKDKEEKIKKVQDAMRSKKKDVDADQKRLSKIKSQTDILNSFMLDNKVAALHGDINQGQQKIKSAGNLIMTTKRTIEKTLKDIDEKKGLLGGLLGGLLDDTFNLLEDITGI